MYCLFMVSTNSEYTLEKTRRLSFNYIYRKNEQHCLKLVTFEKKNNENGNRKFGSFHVDDADAYNRSNLFF